MWSTPVEVQFTSARCLNYPCRTPSGSGRRPGSRAARGNEHRERRHRPKALVDLLSRTRPVIEQAQNLYTENEPLIDQAKKEWQTVGPAAQILIDVISHHVNRGSSPAEAAETVRAAFAGSIKSVAEDHLTYGGMSCATVFGGTGFVGRSFTHYDLDEVDGPIASILGTVCKRKSSLQNGAFSHLVPG
jgi:hypothetical protein